MRDSKRKLWVLAGWVSFALGVIGVFLPVMPTAPFMIVAAYCFSHGSERWYKWLTGHPKFGAPILDWERHGVIRMKAKLISTFLIFCSILSCLFIAKLPEMPMIILGVIFTCVLAFIWTRPSRPNVD